MTPPSQPATTVSGGTPPQNPIPATTPAAPPQQQAPQGLTAEEAAALRREVDDLKSRTAEYERTAQYWFERANKDKGGEPGKPAAAEDDDVDLLDVISTKGVKGLEEVMKKRGYVRGEDVDAKVESRARQLTREAELLGQYPELKDQSSEFFQSTAREYGALTKQGVPPEIAMELAAQRVELQQVHSGKRKSRVQTSDEDKAQREAERRVRAQAQSGDRGTQPSAGADDDDELTPEQKMIAQRMGISEDAYRTRAKKGVAMGGKHR